MSQTTWLRLAEQLSRIRDPKRLGAWLVTTARRECLRTLRGQQRQVLVEEYAEWVSEDGELAWIDDLANRERDAALWSTFNSLPPDCKALLRALLTEPRLSYSEISEAFEMPIGSIGPKRARCLDRLRTYYIEHPLYSQGGSATNTSERRV